MHVLYFPSMSYTFLLYCVYIKETGKLEGGLKPECFFFQVDVLISGGGGGGGRSF